MNRIGWVAAAFALSFALVDVTSAQAGTATPRVRAEHPRVLRQARPRIQIYPGRALYRECVDGYHVVPRPYWGENVVMPYMRCRWVRG